MSTYDPFVADVCWYDRSTIDGRLVRFGAITVLQLPLPVMARGGASPHSYELVGRIEAITDGWDDGYSTLMVMGVANRSALPLDDNGDPMYGVGMDLDSMEAEVEDDRMIVTSARLMAITVTSEPAYPKAALRFEEWR